MTAAEERASERLRELEQTHAEAAALARYASLATRIDAALLRRLRLHLVQRANASAEADLWFSDLSESRDGESLVLDPGVAALLREQLAGESLPDGTPALDAAFAHTSAAHRSWPASLRLEEELVYLALRDGAAAAPAVEQLLRPAVAAMAADAQRGVEMSRWVLRAMPRMPDVVRETDAAAAMIVAAIAQLGSGSHMLSGLERRGLPADLSWLLPPAALARRTEIVCDVRANAVIFRARLGDGPASVIEVPETRPIVLDVRWTDAAATGSRVVAVELGAPVLLPSSWRQLELQTLSGEVYQLERTSPPKPAGKRHSIDIDVFISYAHLDNQPLAEGARGWITDLRRALEARLGQLLGRPARIWFDPKLSGSDLFADETAERMRRVAALVAVVSPRYVASEWCRRELDEFLTASDGARLGDKSRVFKVLKTPVEIERMPGPLKQMLGYEFFSVDAETGRARELGPGTSDSSPDSERLYWTKLDDLAHDIAAMVAIVESEASPGIDGAPEHAAPAAEVRQIYLVCDRPDLESVRPLADFLFKRGCEVTLPLFDGDPVEIRELHDATLRECDAVLLYYGKVNEVWLRRGMRELQKLAGVGRTKPMLASGVYIAPPVTEEKARFRTHQMLVITGADGPTADALAPFLEKLQDSK